MLGFPLNPDLQIAEFTKSTLNLSVDHSCMVFLDGKQLLFYTWRMPCLSIFIVQSVGGYVMQSHGDLNSIVI